MFVSFLWYNQWENGYFMMREGNKWHRKKYFLTRKKSKSHPFWQLPPHHMFLFFFWHPWRPGWILRYLKISNIHSKTITKIDNNPTIAIRRVTKTLLRPWGGESENTHWSLIINLTHYTFSTHPPFIPEPHLLIWGETYTPTPTPRLYSIPIRLFRT